MSFDRQLAVWGFVVGLFGTAFSIWTYAETRQFSQITYSISHESLYRPSKILDTSLLVPETQRQISERITQTVVTIWNGGTVPLKGEDTRSKLTISGDSSVSILSHKVALTKILPGSKGFTVSSIERQLEVDWNIFDPGEGIQIVLLSTGNSKSLDVTGRFLPGQAVVRFPVRSLLKGSAVGIAWVGGAFLTILLMASIVPLIKERTSSRFIAGALTAIALITILVTCVISGFYLSYSARSYVGDISPIDPYLTYIDVNREIDYRYVPM